VSVANLSFDSAMPPPGHIAYLIEDEWMDELGRKLVRVSTEQPWILNRWKAKPALPSLASRAHAADASASAKCAALSSVSNRQPDPCRAGKDEADAPYRIEVEPGAPHETQAEIAIHDPCNRDPGEQGGDGVHHRDQ
jgi:hypothetical protein